MTSEPLNYVCLEHSLRTILHDFVSGWFDGDPDGHVLDDPLHPTFFPSVAVAMGQSPAAQPMQVNFTVTRKARSDDVAMLTTREAHGLATGARITVSGVGAGFDGAATTDAGTSGRVVAYESMGDDVAPVVTAGLISAGPAAEIRVVIHPGGVARWLVDGGVQHRDNVLIDFWVRSAIRGGVQTATGAALQVADMLKAVLMTPALVVPLSQRGVQDIQARVSSEVPGGEWAQRKVTVRANLWYVSGKSVAEDSPATEGAPISI